MMAKKVAIITGAASGLGWEIAQQLAGKYQLYLIDVQIEQLQQASAQLVNTVLFGCDLANPKEVDKLIQQIMAHQPNIALLINNAGITHRSLLKHTQVEVLDKVMAVDYNAPVRLTQGLLPQIIQCRSKIVNISSMAGWMPVLGRAGYCAAKAALHQYFETLRGELHGSGVTILMVYPSFIDTPIENNALNGEGNKANHPRSTAGKMQTAQWMVKRIIRAIETDQQRLFGDTYTYFSSVLYKLWPNLFITLMRRQFAAELAGK